MRLIDADALKIDYGFTWDDITPTHDEMYALIDRQPTIEERKMGRWIPQNLNKTDGMVSTAVYYYPKCSVCGHCANYTNFCPNCGARMESNT